MSFINSKTSAFIYAKLTETGRKLLAGGALTYNFWTCGDSEIDYGFDSNTFTLDGNSIIAPKDENPNVKYPISATLSGSVFNTLPAITPTPQVVTNVAKTRGFFTGTTQILNGKFKASGTTTTSALTGGTNIFLTINQGLVSNGDVVLIIIKNPQQTGLTVTIPTVPTASLFYQVLNTSAPSGATVFTLERNLPVFNSGTTSIQAFVFPSGDTINNFYGSASTIPYWNDNTLSFDSTTTISAGDVMVWNFSAVFTEDIAGINTLTYEGVTNFNSKKYAGTKELLNYTSQLPTQKSIGIIHYSNNNISNNYGEELKSGTFILSLPSILWHKSAPAGGSGTGNVIGLTLSAKTTGLNITSNSVAYNTTSIPFILPYDNLVDGNGNIVGKVFYTLKMAIIEDEELVMALTYKSNRNWTLPTLNGSFAAAVSDGQGLIPANNECHVTYLLANESGIGLTTGIHCQNYLKIGRGGTAQNNIKVNFPINQLPYLKTTFNINGGFTANKLYLLVQNTLIGQRPISSNWTKIDVTSMINGYTSGALINANNLEGSSFIIDLATFNGGSIYDVTGIIGAATTAQPTRMQFGDETFAFANIDTQIQAIAYKSSFVFSLPSSQFNNSVNPTYNITSNSTIYISEVGIYNNLNQLVAMGKISNPIAKTNTDTIQIQLDIDF